MSVRVRDLMTERLGELRYEPVGKRVRAKLGGRTVVDTTGAVLVWEPRRVVPSYSVPAEDVTVPLRPSDTRTRCAYKGEASYWSAEVGGELVPDLVWGYPEPLHDAAGVRGLVCFFDERVDVVLDGVRRERPVTPWSSTGQ